MGEDFLVSELIAKLERNPGVIEAILSRLDAQDNGLLSIRKLKRDMGAIASNVPVSSFRRLLTRALLKRPAWRRSANRQSLVRLHC